MTCIRLLGQEVLPAVREIGQGARPQEPVRDERAGQRRLHGRHGQPARAAAE